jgi:hypothetical protein
MATPAILVDDVGLVNFTLTKDCDKTVRAAFSTDPVDLDISGWDFEVAFYLGTALTRTGIIDTSIDPGGITVSSVEKYIDMVFSAESIIAIAEGKYFWDLRFDSGTGNGQILRGQVTVRKV